jgi:hypothetical protein
MNRLTIVLFSVSLLSLGVLALMKTNTEGALSDLQLENIEALSSNESTGFGCGYAAYEKGDAWYEPTRYFTSCKSGCPESSGTTPKYIYC